MTRQSTAKSAKQEVSMPLKLDNEPELREARAALFNVNSVSGWLLLNYVGPSTVHFTAGGENLDVAARFEDNQVQYALVRTVVQDKGTVKTAIRDIFVTWIGPGVGTVEKGNKAAFLAEAQSYLQPFHAEVTVINRNHFNAQTLAEKSHPLSPSHVID
jgi:hypothetical protein